MTGLNPSYKIHIMKVKDLCTLDTQIIEKSETAQAAAQAMQEAKVGSLVVVDTLPNGDLPIGIITDRDIALKVASQDVRPSMLVVADFVSEALLTVRGKEDVYDVLGKMRKKTVRRVPVVDKAGFLIGIISIDDILEFLVGELKEMTSIMKHEPERVPTMGFYKEN